MYLRNEWMTSCWLLFMISLSFLPNSITQKVKSGDSLNIPCHRNSPDFNTCMIKVLHDVRPILKKGVPKMRIQTLEPMFVPQILVKQGSGPVSIDSTFTDQKIHGMTNYMINGIKIDLDNFKMEVDFYLPWLYIEGGYSIKGQILVLPISGSGDSWSNYTTVTGKAVLTGHSESRNGEEYWGIDDLKFSINVKKATIHMNNLFNGNKQLGDAMNNFMSQNFDAVFQELKPVIDEAIAIILKDIIKKLFAKFPVKALFPI
ncbi:hypothetical protein LSTR_LSTR007324 [Laodelphax striatellus]|uniref:Uncharacterized protein n=1 Tax=Laodelphax striatellus TaxID=195883 RepID=A0A482WTX4_LAOST|nr:hypothetical protein LSTR_LSTR007324 [Laodelphax striatellus]